MSASSSSSYGGGSPAGVLGDTPRNAGQSKVSNFGCEVRCDVNGDENPLYDNCEDVVDNDDEVPSWNDVANFVLPHIEMSLSQSVGMSIKFSEMHKNDLEQLFKIERDSFWWILDKIHEKLKFSDWSRVTDDAHFIQNCIRNVATQKYGVVDNNSSIASNSALGTGVSIPSANETEFSDDLSPFMQELIVALHDEKAANIH